MGGQNPTCTDEERLAVEQLAQLKKIPSPAAPRPPPGAPTAAAVTPPADQSSDVAAPAAPNSATYSRSLENTNWHVEGTIAEYREPGRESNFEYEDTLDLETDERVSPRSRPVTELYNPTGFVSSFASVSASAKKKRSRQRKLEQINEDKNVDR